MANVPTSPRGRKDQERPERRRDDRPRDDRARDDRPRDPKDQRDHRDHRDQRDHRDGNGRDRDRSRSPRRERGGRRAQNNRYRSRSPLPRDDGALGRRDSRDKPREDRDPAPDAARDSAPKGPRESAKGLASSTHAPRERIPDRVPDRKPSVSFKADGVPAVKPSVHITREPDAKPDTKMGGTAPDKEADTAVLELDPETLLMIKLMGFGCFKSTKETKVPGNDKNWAIRSEKKMAARQYMNRPGGFNRPLSPGH